jgi:hypothetical protein
MNTPTENKSSAQNEDGEEDDLANEGHLLFVKFNESASADETDADTDDHTKFLRRCACPKEPFPSIAS